MGIQYLNRIIRTYAYRGVREIPLRSLKGKTLAVDTSIYLYRYQAEEALIENMYLMISLFRHYDITPVFVFDGEPPAEKRELLEERKRDKEEAKQRWLELEKELNGTNKNDDEDKINELIEEMDKEKKKFVKISRKDINDVKNLMNAYGVNMIEAEGEADQVCAKLVQKRLVDGCLSEDMDMFVYGCNKVYRYLSLLNSTVVQYDLKKILECLNLTIKEFKQICILSGTDYNLHLDEQVNIYNALKLFGKFKKRNNDDFFVWLNESNRITDYYKLNEVYNMFDIYKIDLNFSKSKFRNKFYNSDDVKNIMKKNGFIYIN
tara:strand:- start:2351 stop:3307 length:957 start_codon:yes stop_codon:yes gene_type:complete